MLAPLAPFLGRGVWRFCSLPEQIAECHRRDHVGHAEGLAKPQPLYFVTPLQEDDVVVDNTALALSTLLQHVEAKDQVYLT